MQDHAAQPTPGPADQGFPKSPSAAQEVRGGAGLEPPRGAPVDSQGEATHEATTPAPESLWQTLRSLARDLPQLFSDRIDLLSLELRRAGRALLQIVVLIVAAAILGITAWLVLWAAIVAGLVELGMPLPVALLLAVAMNVGAATWAAMRVRKLIPSLGLPATRRHLMVSPSPQPVAGAPEPAAP